MDEKPFCFEDWETALRETVAPDLQVGYREGMGTGMSIGNSGNPAILNMGGFIGIAIGIGIEIARIDSEVDSDFDSDSDFDALHEVAADKMRIAAVNQEEACCCQAFPVVHEFQIQGLPRPGGRLRGRGRGRGRK